MNVWWTVLGLGAPTAPLDSILSLPILVLYTALHMVLCIIILVLLKVCVQVLALLSILSCIYMVAVSSIPWQPFPMRGQMRDVLRVV